MNHDRRVIVAVIASTFFVGFGGGVVFPIIPNLGEILLISPFMVGVILSANRVARIVANGPAGALVDRIGTRTLFVSGLLVEAVAVFGYVIALGAPTPEAWFIAARVLWGLGSAAVFATAYTIAADVSGTESRGTNMGVVRAGITLGFPAGLVLGGVVSEFYSIEAAFILAAGFALLASVVAYLAIPETHVSGSRTNVKPWDIDTNVPALTVGLVNAGMFFAYLGALFSTLVLFVDEQGIFVWGFGPQATSGVMMAITVVAASVLMLGGGKITDIQGRRMPMLVSFLVVSFVGYVLLAWASSLPTLVGACLMIGAGFGGTSGPLMALLVDLTPIDRTGRAMGTNNILGDIGGALGPVVTLPIIDIVGFAPVYLACAVIPLLVAGIVIAGVYRETGSINPESE